MVTLCVKPIHSWLRSQCACKAPLTHLCTQPARLPAGTFAYEKGEPPSPKLQPSSASSHIQYSRGYSGAKHPKPSDPAGRAAVLWGAEHSCNHTCSSPHRSSHGKYVRAGMVPLRSALYLPVITHHGTKRCWVPSPPTWISTEYSHIKAKGLDL